MQSSRLWRERINATLGGQHFGEPQGFEEPAVWSQELSFVRKTSSWLGAR